MSDLARFQRDFVAMLDRPQTGPAAIYRNTVLVGAIDALADNFPVCRRILGDEAFAGLAGEHAAAYPPEHAVLAHYGARFPAWLDAHECGEALPYLSDVARCERLWVEALHAADSPVLCSTDLQALAPEALLATRLILHPSARFAWLETPATPIWLAHQDPDCDGCEPEWAGSGALFTRPAFTVQGCALDRAQFALLAALAQGEMLGTAAAMMARDMPDADIGEAISLLLTSGTFAVAC
jgi:hypothetical protein